MMRLRAYSIQIAIVVASTFVAQSRAQADPPTLHCVDNGLTPDVGVNWGDTVTGDQSWEYISGDPLLIAVGSRGGFGVWTCQPGSIERQYSGGLSLGTNVWLNGDDISAHWASSYFGYISSVTAPDAVSHTSSVSGDVSTITTVVMLGALAELRQVVTYRARSYTFKRHWEITNLTGSALTDLRFFHGGDTMFGGTDAARSWWNPAQSMVYVSNASFSTSGTMGLYAAPATPATHHFGGDYLTGDTQASVLAVLDDTVDATYIDAGYQLQWNRAGLAPGATWTIEAYESWTDPTFLAVLVPAEQLARAGTTPVLPFYVHNFDPADRTVDLAASSVGGWTTSIVGGARVTIPALSRVLVNVAVSVPNDAVVDTARAVALTATDQNGSPSGRSATHVVVFEPTYTLTPLALDFGDVEIAQPATRTITLTNTGSAVQVGTVGDPDPVTTPYSILGDTCSNQTISTAGSCTIEIQFEPGAAASFSDALNVPILAPEVTSYNVTVAGVGVFGTCFVPNAPSCPTGDTDGDGVANASDRCLQGASGWTSAAGTDRDADGCRDADEDHDDDGDGKADVVDACPAGSLGWTSNTSTDHDADGCNDNAEDLDDDADGIADSHDRCPAGQSGWTSSSTTDLDGDGCRDTSEDLDDDGDGVVDAEDPEPKDAHQCGDSDDDTCDDCSGGSRQPESDGVDTDADGACDQGDSDDDGDGVRDTSDPSPLDPSRCGDRDDDSCDDCSVTGTGGGALDNDGEDSDEDGKCDANDDRPDRDRDGIPDASDLDADGDGISNQAEGGGDADHDDIPNWLDLDSDGDGIFDLVEVGLSELDSNGDGRIDDRSDADKDGLVDAVDFGAGGRRVTPPDHDEDGVADFFDDDSDGDGVPDSEEAFQTDTDSDGVPNYLDNDDDGDSIPTSDEGGGDQDTDGDGIADYLDDDDDGDTIPSRSERGVETKPRDTDGDGKPDYLDADDDGDGISTKVEAALKSKDIDHDDVPNYRDTDSDGDGVSDREERNKDSDGDGIPDYRDPATLGLAGGALCTAVPGARTSGSPLVLLFGLLVLGLIAIRRRALLKVVSVVIVAAAALASVSSARADGFQLNSYRTPPLANDGLQLAQPATLEANQWSVGVNFDYANDPLVMELNSGSADSEYASVVGSQLNAHAAIAYGAADQLSLFGVFSAVLLEQGERTPMPGTAARARLADGAGLGDARFGARLRLAGGGRLDRAGFGVQAAVVVPFAELSDGDQNFRGESSLAGDFSLLGDVDLKIMRLGAAAGVRVRNEINVLGSRLGNELTFGLGLRVPLVKQTLEALLEAHVSTMFADAFSRSSTPIEMLAGLRASLRQNWRFSLGAGPGLQRGIGSPDYRLLAGVAFLTSVATEEAMTYTETAEPLNADQDGDQILDSDDRCPTEPEDVDGFEDQDGCPDNDNDGDGILDAVDHCPNEAEDKDGVEDDDGCIDGDNDHDGILDALDHCPNEAEDLDGNADDDGCPDLDDDGDGVPDTLDKCPTVRGDAAHQGCSTTVSLEGGQIRISQRVEFETGSGEILPVSDSLLRDVAGVFETNPKLRVVIVQGHTDSRGSDRRNLELSKLRSASVVSWLTRHGIDRERLAAWGCGETQLMASDRTGAGRQQNRRVEFHIAEPPPETAASQQGCVPAF